MRAKAESNGARRGRAAVGAPEVWGFLGVLLLALALTTQSRLGLAAVGGGAGNTTTTTSTTNGTVFTFYGPGGGFLSSPAVLAALQKAAAAGPSAVALNHTETSVTTTTTFGPATILIGDDQSQTFFVAAGTTNVNTNVHTQRFLDVNFSASSPAFAWVTGDFHASFQTALLEQNWSFLDALFGQLRGLDVNGAGPGAGLNTQFAALGADDTRGVNIAQAGPDGRMRPSRWFVWVRPFGVLGKIDSSAERLGFRYDIAGVSAGLEYHWPGPWIAGATLGYAHTSLIQRTTNDKGSIESLQIGAYGGYRDARTHAVVAALFQQNWIGSERLTALSPTIATASYSAQAYSVGFEAGRKYPVMGAWVQPLASLVFTHVRQGGFSESGATLLEIASASTSTNALKLSLGARVWREFDMGWGTITPEFRARWVQDLLNERRAITVRFVGDASQTAFSVNGAKPTPAAAVIGGGVTLGAGPGFKLTLAYDAELRANSRSHTIQAQLKLRW